MQTQGAQADLLLQRLEKRIEEAQARVGLRPTDVRRVSATRRPVHMETVSAGGVADTVEAELEFAQPPATGPEWFVSYAWGDATPEGRACETVVDELCAAAKAKGRRILRDKEVLDLGDSISAFMARIGAGDRVFVILSDKYLRSPNCMFELGEVWRRSCQEGETFLERVRVYALPDAKVRKPDDWVDWAIHRKQEHDGLDGRARRHGAAILGAHGHRRLMQMQRFSTQVSDILGTLADIVQPRSFEELERYGFDDLAHKASPDAG